MDIDVHHINLQPTDALDEFARRQAHRALRPFAESVERVEVRIEDVNGPRGGADKRCSATAQLAGIKRKLVVKRTSPDAYDAVQAACGRLGETVSRALARRQRLGRAAPPPQAQVQTGAPVPLEGRVQVTASDLQRLRSVMNSWPGDEEAIDALADELDRADIVPAERIAGNVVTMNSRVVFRDEKTGRTREVLLVYPRDSDPEHGRISVLAPIGSALLGLSVGQTIDWPLPRGQVKRLRIVDVVAQPGHANGMYA